MVVSDELNKITNGLPLEDVFFDIYSKEAGAEE